MNRYILIDENNICRCIATEKCNLHKNKLHMKMVYTDKRPIIGDEIEIIGKKGSIIDINIIKRPENYPENVKRRLKRDERERKIQAEIRRIAEKSLIERGEIE